MTVFKRTLLADAGVARIESEALGTNAGDYGTAQVGTLVKLTANSYVQVAAGDEVVGQVQSVEPSTVNDGFSFGAVKKSHRIEALVGANGDTVAVTVGALVVADVQPALALGGVGHVKVGAPAIHKWQVIAVTGAGASGETALLQKV